MQKNRVLVSVSCLAYNHEKFIEKAIESFLMQKVNFKYEIIIHDDASTDRTTEIIKKYEEKYPEIIKPIYQKENQYSKKDVSITKDFILPKTQGKYIAFCEGDDFWTDENKLQKQVEYMERNPECGLCFHTVDIYDDKKKEIIGKIKTYEKSQISTTDDIILGDGDFMGTNSIFCRRVHAVELPKFYRDAPVGDYPMQIFFSMNNYAYFMEETMSAYRVNTGTSWTSRIEKNYSKKMQMIQRIINMLEEVDSYSKGKYHKAITRMISKKSFDILRYNLIINELSKEEYRKYFSRLTLSGKLDLFRKKIKKLMKKS